MATNPYAALLSGGNQQLQLTPSNQSRLQIAQALQGQGLSAAPAQSWAQVLGRLAQTAAGAKIRGDITEQQQGRKQALAETLRSAVGANAGVAGAAPGVPGGPRPPSVSPQVRALMANPDTVRTGFQLAMANRLQGTQDLGDLQTGVGPGGEQVFFRMGAQGPQIVEGVRPVPADPELGDVMTGVVDGRPVFFRPTAEGAQIIPGVTPTPDTDGLRLTVGPDGQVTFARGAELGSKAQNTVEDKILNTQDTLARLEGIEESFQPEFLEIPTRLGFAWDALSDKLSIGELAPAERRGLQQFTTFKRRTLENLNRVVRQLSGAAMTQSEAQRIQAAQPSVGTGPFGGDSPTVFKAKLDDVSQRLRATLQRYQDLRQRGLIGPRGSITPDLAQSNPLSEYLPEPSPEAAIPFNSSQDVLAAPIEQVRETILNLSEAELNALPQEVTDAMLQRLQQ